MKTKTSELTGTALDYATAVAAGLPRKIEIHLEDRKSYCYLLSEAGYRTGVFKPSTDWSQGGPIIDREKIEVVRGNDLYFPKGNEKGDLYESLWLARLPLMDIPRGYSFHGQTPLIATMRCYVASKLGDEVEIPEELK